MKYFFKLSVCKLEHLSEQGGGQLFGADGFPFVLE